MDGVYHPNPHDQRHVKEWYDPMARHISTSCGSPIKEIMFPWAPGQDWMTTPAVAGFRVGGAEGYHAFELNVHYDNPGCPNGAGCTSGIVDSSTVRVFFARTLRQHDVGVLSLGDGATQLAGKPIAAGHAPFSSHSFTCGGWDNGKHTLVPPVTPEESAPAWPLGTTSACTEPGCTSHTGALSGAHVFARFLHMHAAGETMTTVIERMDLQRPPGCMWLQFWQMPERFTFTIRDCPEGGGECRQQDIYGSLVGPFEMVAAQLRIHDMSNAPLFSARYDSNAPQGLSESAFREHMRVDSNALLQAQVGLPTTWEFIYEDKVLEDMYATADTNDDNILTWTEWRACVFGEGPCADDSTPPTYVPVPAVEREFEEMSRDWEEKERGRAFWYAQCGDGGEKKFGVCTKYYDEKENECWEHTGGDAFAFPPLPGWPYAGKLAKIVGECGPATDLECELDEMNFDFKHVRTDSVQAYDFRMSGAHYPMTTGEGFYLSGAEKLTTTCVYKTPEDATAAHSGKSMQDQGVRFGLGSDDEMCIDFLMYYPKGALNAQCGRVEGHYTRGHDDEDEFSSVHSSCRDADIPACVQSMGWCDWHEDFLGYILLGSTAQYPTPESCWAGCMNTSLGVYQHADLIYGSGNEEGSCWCTQDMCEFMVPYETEGVHMSRHSCEEIRNWTDCHADYDSYSGKGNYRIDCKARDPVCRLESQDAAGYCAGDNQEWIGDVATIPTADACFEKCKEKYPIFMVAEHWTYNCEEGTESEWCGCWCGVECHDIEAHQEAGGVKLGASEWFCGLMHGKVYSAPDRCMNFGWDSHECESIGCCTFDSHTQQCYSNRGDGLCGELKCDDGWKLCMPGNWPHEAPPPPPSCSCLSL